MKNLLFLLIAFLFFACAPKKIITATKTEDKTSIQNEIKDSRSSQSDVKKTVVDLSNTDTETVTETTTYDSDKPNIPGTDKPPVKEVKKVTEKKSNKSNVNVSTEAKNKVEAKHEDNSKSDIDNKSDTVIKEIPKAPAVKYWLMLFGFIAVAILLLKYWSVIKSFLGLK